MAIEKARAYLRTFGLEDRVIETEMESATVETAAAALGCEPGRIAKSLSFLQGDQPVLVLAEGTARVDNHKYKAEFGCKAKMIKPDQVQELIGHEPGGVCPFGVEENVKVYLDESLKHYDIVYPAAGNDHSAVRLTIEEFEKCSRFLKWVDVCKE